MLKLKLISEKNLRKTKRGKGTYSEYKEAIEKKGLVTWLNQKLLENDGQITIKASELAKELGKQFEDKQELSIYWGIKYVLFNEGFVVDSSTGNIINQRTGRRSHYFVIRKRMPEDKLPESLLKRKNYKEIFKNESKEREVPEDEINENKLLLRKIDELNTRIRSLEFELKESTNIIKRSEKGNLGIKGKKNEKKKIDKRLTFKELKRSQREQISNIADLLPKIKKELKRKEIVEIDANDLVEGLKTTTQYRSILYHVREYVRPFGIMADFKSRKTSQSWGRTYIFRKI